MPQSEKNRYEELLEEAIVELRSYATLFTSIDNDCIDSQDLIGIGINLGKINEKLLEARKLLNSSKSR